MISDDSHMSVDQSPMKVVEERNKRSSYFSKSWVEMYDESNERRQREEQEQLLSGLGEITSPESLIDDNAQLDTVSLNYYGIISMYFYNDIHISNLK